MKKSVNLWQFVGFAVTALGGTLLHFLYEWTNSSKAVAPFASVNESTWEHMKLLFWPMLVFAIIQSLFVRREDFFCIKLRGILLGLAMIPVLFYSYNGIIGKSPDWVNVGIFMIAAAASYIYEAILFKRKRICSSQTVSVVILAVLAILFVTFTFVTPMLGIFKDPVTGAYGI